MIYREEQGIGMVRLYDARANSFCWGCWIIANSQPSLLAIESALMVYSHALDHLSFGKAYFDVCKANEKVWRFYECFGAKRAGSSGEDNLYAISSGEIRGSLAV